MVSRSGCDAHTDPIFLNGIHLLQLGQFMYSFSTGNLPTKFDSFFSVNKCIHSYKHKVRFLFSATSLAGQTDKAVFYILSGT